MKEIFKERVANFWLHLKKTTSATQNSIAKESGLTQPRVHQILGGSGYPVTLSGLSKLCTIFNVDILNLVPELENEYKTLQTLLQENRFNEATLKILELNEIHNHEKHIPYTESANIRRATRF